ncbi:hypothetical protein PLICRDRAFT_588604 [Plicaturopsis crispa FD-325 SS-3]|nr:hypothetical protein PLICRDRAFT_588604 [Plicaturopsis crispa FD-325 SS-3]
MALRPLITICGTTGVGKSKLAIELAQILAQSKSRWTGARIINADSMQVYAGLDVITNKVPEDQRQGVDHLLMGFKQPGEQYVVGQWVQDAVDAIDATHNRNEIPIVVGGTSYWIQHLIFPNRLASSGPSSSDSSTPSPLGLNKSIAQLPPELIELLQNLPVSPALDDSAAYSLHTLLKALDPTVAARWHWRDTRKVLRSLCIIKETGRRPSEIISEQAQAVPKPRYRTLSFWLYAEPSVLNSRLNTRVDEMIEQGLLDEIRQMRELKASRTNNPNFIGDDSSAEIDYTLGIYQSIGYKEFDAYLNLPEPSEQDFQTAAHAMKNATRKYAKRQVSWIRNKLLPAAYAANALCIAEPLITPIYLLDATELGEKWDSNVLGEAQRITRDFMDGRELPNPLSLSETARELLTIADKPTDPSAVLVARRRMTCAVCTVDEERPVMIEEGQEWEAHRKTRSHRRMAAKKEGKEGERHPLYRKVLQRSTPDPTDVDLDNTALFG